MIAPILLLAVLHADPLQVRVVTGGHDHEASFYSLFEGDPRFHVTVNPHPSAFGGNLGKRTQVLVLYDMIVRSDEAMQKALRAYAEAGKGIVILHHAICSHANWPWWHEEVAGGVYLPEPMKGMEKSTFKHDEWIDVNVAKPHPVTEGISDFRIFDETYKGMWFSPKIDVLLRTGNPTSDGPVAWVSPYKASRVVVIQLGHGREAHLDANYRRLVRNAIAWAGGR
jgi:hypothetical protein